jgi:hypothetical protein
LAAIRPMEGRVHEIHHISRRRSARHRLLAGACSRRSPPEFPEYDSAAACAKIDPKPDAFSRLCIRLESEAMEGSQFRWSGPPSDLQTHCINVVALNAPSHVRHQSLHQCLNEMFYDQHEFDGDIPVSIRKKWLDDDIKALKERQSTEGRRP